MTAITIEVRDNLNPTSAVEGVVVRVYNQAGDSFVTQLTTDSSGTVTTDVPDATYWVRFYKSGYSFQSKLLIEVDAAETNSWLITANDLTELPPSGADGICRVSGYLIDAQGAPSHLPILTFMVPIGKRIMGRNIIGTEKIAAQPNSDGYFEVELIQNLKYEVVMASISDEVLTVKVPSLQACNITDLIYPMGKLLSSLPSTATVTVGEDTEVSVSLGASSGISLPDTDMGLTVSTLFSVETSPTSGLSVAIAADKLTLNASEAGTYTVSLYGKCKEDYSVEGNTLLGTITVTANAST